MSFCCFNRQRTDLVASQQVEPPRGLHGAFESKGVEWPTLQLGLCLHSGAEQEGREWPSLSSSILWPMPFMSCGPARCGRVNHALDTKAGNQGCSFEYGKKQRDRDTDVENESGHDMRERAVAKSGTRSRKMWPTWSKDESGRQGAADGSLMFSRVIQKDLWITLAERHGRVLHS